MNERLRGALAALSSLEHQDLSPVARGSAREAALVAGLHALAAEYGRTIEFTQINANGEMPFNVTSHGGYGEQLAGWLSRIPRRTGVRPTSASVLPENGWCWINHFDAERLLNMIACQ